MALQTNTHYSSYYSSVSAQLATQLGQQQYSAQELAQQATASRAKRLDSLLGQLSNTIEDAVSNISDPALAQQTENEYVAYVLKRLHGDQTAKAPESLGEFAYALDALVHDVLVAWDALQAAGDMAQQQQQNWNSLSGVMQVLEDIASRRVKTMLNNAWYQRWRQIYRNPTVDQEASQLAHADQGSLMLQFLKDAVDLSDESGMHLLNADKRADLSRMLSLASSPQ